MKNRFVTGVVAIATSVAVLGSGVAVADEIDDQYNACIDAAQQLDTTKAKADAYRDCEATKALAEKAKEKKEKDEAKAVEKNQYENIGSLDSDTWANIYKDVKKEDKSYDSKHPYPAWLAFLKYVQILITKISDQLKPIFNINKIIQELAPKA